MDRLKPYLLYMLITSISVALYAGCKNYSGIQYTYEAPIDLKDGIEVADLTETNIDTSLIFQAVKRIKAGVLGQNHSFLVYKNDKLILEEYFPGNVYKWDNPGHRGEYLYWDHTHLHSVMSVTKSVTSTSIGIAIDKGFIRSVNQSIFDYLPDHQHLKTEQKDKITIEHLLTMTSGFEWQEWTEPYSSIKNPMIGIWYSDKDPLSFILEGELKYQPGTHFTYYGGSQILLGEILKNATSLSIDEFSNEYLFKPLDIDSVHWSVKFENGVIEAAGGLKMKPRDMLKLGITFLNNGVWNQTQIVSKNWVANSSTSYPENKSIKVPGEDSGKVEYTYSWWSKKLMLDNEEVILYWASGWGGQKIIVIPDAELVVVFTGGNYSSGSKHFRILKDFIIPAGG